MSFSEAELNRLRNSILADPALILEDRDVMQALLAANDASVGENVVDLRGRFVQHLETRLDKLENTHRTVVAAAYENLAGTNQVHRAILALLEPGSFNDFLHCLTEEITAILSVDAIWLMLEADGVAPGSALGPDGRRGSVRALAESGVADYIGSPRKVTLRKAGNELRRVFGSAADGIGSEAVLALDMGEGLRPGMLVIGATDPLRFHPDQGTDLLAFFAGVFERAMRRWLVG